MNNDLISREALLKAAKSPCKNCKETMKSWCEHCCPVNDFVDFIENAPTVEPERPQGEWELHGMIYYCSVCGHYCGEGMNNFCGNCGADMRKLTEGEGNNG